MKSPLRLLDEAATNDLRAALLDNDSVRSLVQKLSSADSYASLITACTLTAHFTGASSVETYAERLCDTVRDALTRSNSPSRTPFHLLGLMLHALQVAAPELHAQLNREFDPAQVAHLITANGTLVDLFGVIQNASPSAVRQIVLALDESITERLVANTIQTRRSIGTLSFALRELARHEDTVATGIELQRKTGAKRFLRLIKSNGTIFDLFNILQYASADLAKDVVASLSDDAIEHLVAKTVDQGRSVATLSFALRAWKRHTATRGIGDGLERRIGASRFLHLIRLNGTIFELFNISQHSSPRLAREIADALTDDVIEDLITKTVRAGRSIGTLHLALRGLEQETETVSVSRELQRKIGAERFLRLIESNGTIFELIELSRFVTPSLATEMIATLSERRSSALIQRSIAAGRSIGTLNLGLRELYSSAETSGIARSLEQKVGAERFLHLIDANGTLFELFRIIQYVSPPFARELVDSVDDSVIDRLVARTISVGRSISTLHFALRDLHRSEATRGVARDLEFKLGSKRYLQVIAANGTVVDLVKVLENSSPEFARQLVDAVDDTAVEGLVDRAIVLNRSIGTLHMTLKFLRYRPQTVDIVKTLERRIGAPRLVRLIEANGTVIELCGIAAHVAPVISQSVVALLDEERVAGLIDRAIADRRSIGTLNFAFRELYRGGRATRVAESLEQRIGAAGLWRLVIGTGSPGPLIDLMRDVSPGFRQSILCAAAGVFKEQWVGILERGGFYQLCELIVDAQELFDEQLAVTGLRDATAEVASRLASSGTWYERGTGAKRLKACKESPAKIAAVDALTSFLSTIEIDTLAFASLREAVNGIELLYEARPAERARLMARLREILPVAESWCFDPKEDMALPKILLKLLAHSEVSDSDWRHFSVSLLNSFGSELIEKCRTVDLLWMLWGLFAAARTRDTGLEPAVFGRNLPVAFVESLRNTVAIRLTQRAKVDEIRARFALVGLLALLAIEMGGDVRASLREELLRNEDASAWWLCANQTFVVADLVLRAVAIGKPLTGALASDFRRRLLSAASEYPEMYPAADYLYQQLLHARS